MAKRSCTGVSEWCTFRSLVIAAFVAPSLSLIKEWLPFSIVCEELVLVVVPLAVELGRIWLLKQVPPKPNGAGPPLPSDVAD